MLQFGRAKMFVIQNRKQQVYEFSFLFLISSPQKLNTNLAYTISIMFLKGALIN
jgi:hypothetical protein